jgi:hypothetical protein
MSLLLADWKLSNRQVRLFAWVTALALALVAWRSHEPTVRLGFKLLAALVFAIGTVWPGLVRWIYQPLVILAFAVVWVFRQRLRVTEAGRQTPQ